MTSLLDVSEYFLWTYFGVPFIVLIGLIFTWKSRGYQLWGFPAMLRRFFGYCRRKENAGHGVHPIKVFFASVGGCIGIGNVVVVCTAVQVGGPGAVFWLWVAALLGMLVKYAEIYLGVSFRVKNSEGSYDGGPMYFLRQASSSGLTPLIVSVLLCVYGVEVYMFRVVTESISYNAGIPCTWVMVPLFILVFAAASGGVKRVGLVCEAVIPIFLVVFGSMVLFVLANEWQQVPAALSSIFRSAFCGHAAVGGFAGSTLLLAMSEGIKRACYTGDIGIGYASVIHSETSLQDPKEQASFAIFGIFLDTFVVCTLSLLVILTTGVWMENVDPSQMVQLALEKYFPWMHIFMPAFIFLLGYSTIIAYLIVGLKCAKYLSPLWGPRIYYSYAAAAFVFFSFTEPRSALSVMAVSGALLLVFNLYGIFRLRHHVQFFSD